MAAAPGATHAPHMGRRNDTRPLLERRRIVFVTALVLAGVAWGLRLVAGWTPLQALLLHLGVMSAFTFALFAIDKRRAANDGRRVSEANLLMASFLGGAVGGLMGMFLLRHKSQRWKFRILLTAFALAQAAAVALVATT